MIPVWPELAEALAVLTDLEMDASAVGEIGELFAMHPSDAEYRGRDALLLQVMGIAWYELKEDHWSAGSVALQNAWRARPGVS